MEVKAGVQWVNTRKAWVKAIDNSSKRFDYKGEKSGWAIAEEALSSERVWFLFKDGGHWVSFHVNGLESEERLTFTRKRD